MVCSDGMPACGCDGHTYDSACAAAIAGVDVSDLGGCPAPADMFPCGSSFCFSAVQYCYHFAEGFGPDTNECKPLPAACAAEMPPTCACLVGEPQGAECQQTGSGLTVFAHL